MPLDEVIRIAISRLGVVRVSNALNPLLYMALVVLLASWGFAWLFRDDPILKYGLVTFGGVFALAFLGHYTRFSLTDPDRLQSEEYLVRKQELSIIERKGVSGPEILPPSDEERPIGKPDWLSRRNEGEGS